MIISELFEAPQLCPECGGISFSNLILAEKKDACYHKVKASAKVWPSAYASGRLVQCRKKSAGNYGNSKNESVAEGSLEEGVNDPHIFKAIAMIGPMGAGKSTIARQLVGGSGLRSLNLDNFNELLIKQGKVVGGNLTPDQLERSWQLTQAQKGNWVNGRLGLLIDGSGRNVEGLVKPLLQLEALGYDTMVILVNVSLETSLQRQQSRAAQQAQQYGTGRNVPADLAKSSYDQIQQNIPKLQQLYGNKLLIINNEGAVDLTQEKTIVDRFLSAPPSKPAAVEWIKSQGASQGQQLDKRLAQQQRQQSAAQRAPTYTQQGVAENANAVDINQIASQMQFLPTTKLAKQYKFVKDGAPGQMPAMTYTVSSQEQPVVTVTSDGKETQNVATPNDVIMSGPSRENYVVKAAKFPKLYQGTMGGPVIPEQSPRLVALYVGKVPVTFTAPWGESMVLKPGDYLVKDGDAGYYRIAKVEYDQTYNKPGSNGQQGMAEGQLELNTPDPVVVVQDQQGKILDKVNLSVAAQKYKLGQPQNIKNQLAHQNYTKVGNYTIVSPMSGQPQDQTTIGQKSTFATTEGEQQKGADYRDPKEVDYDDDYDAMVARVKRLAGLGPMKTVYDPNKRVYRNMPTAVQPKK